MKLDRVTITGADDSISPADLSAISPCCGLFGKLFGHKFIPIYETRSPEGQILEVKSGDGLNIMDVLCSLTEENLVESLTHLNQNKYVGNICVRCGIEYEI